MCSSITVFNKNYSRGHEIPYYDKNGNISKAQWFGIVRAEKLIYAEGKKQWTKDIVRLDVPINGITTVIPAEYYYEAYKNTQHKFGTFALSQKDRQTNGLLALLIPSVISAEKYFQPWVRELFNWKGGRYPLAMLITRPAWLDSERKVHDRHPILVRNNKCLIMDKRFLPHTIYKTNLGHNVIGA